MFLSQTKYKDTAEAILAVMRHDAPNEKDLDVLHTLLKYHDLCVPLIDTVIAFV